MALPVQYHLQLWTRVSVSPASVVLAIASPVINILFARGASAINSPPLTAQSALSSAIFHCLYLYGYTVYNDLVRMKMGKLGCERFWKTDFRKIKIVRVITIFLVSTQVYVV